jgi:hypothetical protein
MAKPTRGKIVQFARELGFPFPSTESNKLIDQAALADDPLEFLRQQAEGTGTKGNEGNEAEPDQSGEAHSASPPSLSSLPSVQLPPVGAAESGGGIQPPLMCLTTLPGGAQEYRTVLEDVIGQHLAEVPEHSYRRRHVDLKLAPASVEFVARLFAGLNQRAARLANGRFVQNANDAVRWLIEQSQLATTHEVTVPAPSPNPD